MSLTILNEIVPESAKVLIVFDSHEYQLIRLIQTQAFQEDFCNNKLIFASCTASVGDIYICEVPRQIGPMINLAIIERKTISDLISTLVDKDRLRNIYELRNSCLINKTTNILMVEDAFRLLRNLYTSADGRLTAHAKFYHSQLPVQALFSFLNRISMHLSVMLTINLKHTLRVIIDLAVYFITASSAHLTAQRVPMQFFWQRSKIFITQHTFDTLPMQVFLPVKLSKRKEKELKMGEIDLSTLPYLREWFRIYLTDSTTLIFLRPTLGNQETYLRLVPGINITKLPEYPNFLITVEAVHDLVSLIKVNATVLSPAIELYRLADYLYKLLYHDIPVYQLCYRDLLNTDQNEIFTLTTLDVDKNYEDDHMTLCSACPRKFFDYDAHAASKATILGLLLLHNFGKYEIYVKFSELDELLPSIVHSETMYLPLLLLNGYSLDHIITIYPCFQEIDQTKFEECVSDCFALCN